MATPLTADQVVAALRAEGVTVIEVDGWRTNNRNHKGPWGPVNGSMLHHTVTPKTMSAVPMCFRGTGSLPGPLCHGVIRRDGTVHMVGNGRANHAGGGDGDVLAAVKAESYNTRPPAPNEHDGSDGAVDGNRAFYGWECENEGDGKDPWPKVQVEAMVRSQAAVIRAHRAQGDDWGAKSCIGHLEWSDWKSDPKGPDNVVSMPGLRTRINERLLHPASWNPGTTTPKPPTPAPTGGTVNLTHLTRTTSTPLLPDSPVRIYWENEYADEPNQHGAGGFSVLSQADWTANLHLFFSGLGPDEALQVRHIETPPGGTAQEGPLANVNGFRDKGSVTRVVTLIGRIQNGEALSFEVTNLGAGTVTLLGARLLMHSTPL
ncbi:N-acetylmuramoyl-L-alanine amidase [Streptomyces sp. NPDC094447]|uniref:peptidoglycan recognition protein family protein n=1 Tax=Streptomyces sp. NPDC094447 TaxID=3366062 RepID=UPI0038266755